MNSETHFRPLVLIPTYNTGERLPRTVEEVLGVSETPVWVVVDGSSDGSDALLSPLQEKYSEGKLRVIRLKENRGKGCAVLAGAEIALDGGFTHVLTVDADGQHPAEMIPRYLEAAQTDPEALIIGQPVFDDSAPRIRVNGRKVANLLAAVEVGGGVIGDALFGMRLYPLQAFVRRMKRLVRWGANRYDFEPEIAVRLVWDGVPTLKLATPVKYFNESEGGISHYHYWRDNLKMAAMHAFRLLPGTLLRAPMLLRRKFLERRKVFCLS